MLSESVPVWSEIPISLGNGLSAGDWNVDQLLRYALKRGLAGKCFITGGADTRREAGRGCMKSQKAVHVDLDLKFR